MIEANAYGSAVPPLEYYEKILLPQRGWSYSEQKRLSLAERHELFRLLDIEARYRPKEK